MSSSSPNTIQYKLAQLADPSYPSCREDIIWLLEYIKKKIVEPDPQMDLSQPQILINFRHFAEISLQLIHRRPILDRELDPLITWIHETF